MNIIFLGSSGFAVPHLSALLNTRHSISCVVTQPDRKAGRHLHALATPVKVLAQQQGLKVFQPEDINSRPAIEQLIGFKPDIFIVIAYGQILSQEVLDIPTMLAINVHASLLPKYRGAAPINRCLINGDKKTGISIIKMSKRMDAGEILAQKTMPIEEDDDSTSLEQKMSHQGAELLLDLLLEVENHSFRLIPQDERKASLAPKLKKKDGLIHWGKPAGEILNLVRGCQPWPGAYTYYRGKLLKIFRARAEKGHLGFLSRPIACKPGQILKACGEEFIVAAGKGELSIEELQIEGKKEMVTRDFLAGHKLTAGEDLG